ncbi:glycosyltransferase family 4 protein [Parafrigoribacterium humi]|jgi:glycosyltransferase involved in cell wall biosynthesis|uniref:glycosyltransferase family 4 protein n=1 Tax=Parafrigoribacterium humi TaxID=3144664 RepID=UPI0032ECF007
MRIAIVSDYFLDYVGGAQTSMRQQQLALEEAGNTVFMVSASRGIWFGGTRVVGDGIQLHPNFTIPGLQLPIIPNNRRTRSALRRFFREQAIDVVHLQTEFSLAHAATAVARELGIRVVHTVHTFYWASEGGPQASIAWFLRWALELVCKTTFPRKSFTPRAADNLLRNLTLGMTLMVDEVVSPSAHQARDLAAAGVTGEIALVPNPVTTSQRPSLPLSLADGRKPNFLWVARCEPVKRPLVFARAALTALERTENGFSVDFVGDGAELAELTELVAGHPEIRVNGALPHEAVLDLMDASSAVVLTSVGFDNQPMTIAEAVSRERGVLYCDPKLREGLLNAGYLSETPDAAGLADALVTLVTEPERLLAISHGAAIDRTAFAPQSYVERILAVYRG